MTWRAKTLLFGWMAAALPATMTAQETPSFQEGVSSDKAPSLAQLRQDALDNPENGPTLHKLARELVRRGDDRQALFHFEKAIRLSPDDPLIANDYRMSCIRLEEFDRSIELLKDVLKSHPGATALHLNLAFAYIDKMPQVGTIRQGMLSRRSVGEFEEVLSAWPDNWLAHYGIGMNYLHWPRLFKKLGLSIEHFRKCLKIQANSSSRPEYYSLAYLGLGDALLRNGQTAEARRIWQQGRIFQPQNAEIRERLEQDDPGVEKLVETKRDLKRRIDTDLSDFVEREER